MDHREKRSVPRVKAGIMVEIYDEHEKNLLGIGTIANLGINCAGLETIVVLVNGKKFVMRFLIEKKFLVNVHAVVARSQQMERKRYYGVRFDKIDLLGVECLQQYINQQLKETRE